MKVFYISQMISGLRGVGRYQADNCLTFFFVYMVFNSIRIRRNIMQMAKKD